MISDIIRGDLIFDCCSWICSKMGCLNSKIAILKAKCHFRTENILFELEKVGFHSFSMFLFHQSFSLNLIFEFAQIPETQNGICQSAYFQRKFLLVCQVVFFRWLFRTSKLMYIQTRNNCLTDKSPRLQIPSGQLIDEMQAW